MRNCVGPRRGFDSPALDAERDVPSLRRGGGRCRRQLPLDRHEIQDDEKRQNAHADNRENQSSVVIHSSPLPPFSVPARRRRGAIRAGRRGRSTFAPSKITPRSRAQAFGRRFAPPRLKAVVARRGARPAPGRILPARATDVAKAAIGRLESQPACSDLPRRLSSLAPHIHKRVSGATDTRKEGGNKAWVRSQPWGWLGGWQERSPSVGWGWRQPRRRPATWTGARPITAPTAPPPTPTPATTGRRMPASRRSRSTPWSRWVSEAPGRPLRRRRPALAHHHYNVFPSEDDPAYGTPAEPNTPQSGS